MDFSSAIWQRIHDMGIIPVKLENPNYISRKLKDIYPHNPSHTVNTSEFVTKFVFSEEVYNRPVLGYGQSLSKTGYSPEAESLLELLSNDRDSFLSDMESTQIKTQVKVATQRPTATMTKTVMLRSAKVANTAVSSKDQWSRGKVATATVNKDFSVTDLDLDETYRQSAQLPSVDQVRVMMFGTTSFNKSVSKSGVTRPSPTTATLPNIHKSKTSTQQLPQERSVTSYAPRTQLSIEKFFKSIDLSNHGIESIDHGLSRFSDVIELSLSRNKLRYIDINHLPLRLCALDVYNNNMSSFTGFDEGQQSLTNLLHIGLAFNEMISLASLLPFKHSLQALNISYNNIADFDQFIVHIMQFTSLTHLHVAGNPFTALPYYRIAIEKCAPWIKFIDDQYTSEGGESQLTETYYNANITEVNQQSSSSSSSSRPTTSIISTTTPNDLFDFIPPSSYSLPSISTELSLPPPNPISSAPPTRARGSLGGREPRRSFINTMNHANSGGNAANNNELNSRSSLRKLAYVLSMGFAGKVHSLNINQIQERVLSKLNKRLSLEESADEHESPPSVVPSPAIRSRSVSPHNAQLPLSPTSHLSPISAQLAMFDGILDTIQVKLADVGTHIPIEEESVQVHGNVTNINEAGVKNDAHETQIPKASLGFSLATCSNLPNPYQLNNKHDAQYVNSIVFTALRASMFALIAPRGRGNSSANSTNSATGVLLNSPTSRKSPISPRRASVVKDGSNPSSPPNLKRRSSIIAEPVAEFGENLMVNEAVDAHDHIGTHTENTWFGCDNIIRNNPFSDVEHGFDRNGQQNVRHIINDVHTAVTTDTNDVSTQPEDLTDAVVAASSLSWPVFTKALNDDEIKTTFKPLLSEELVEVIVPTLDKVDNNDSFNFVQKHKLPSKGVGVTSNQVVFNQGTPRRMLSIDTGSHSRQLSSSVTHGFRSIHDDGELRMNVTNSTFNHSGVKVSVYQALRRSFPQLLTSTLHTRRSSIDLSPYSTRSTMNNCMPGSSRENSREVDGTVNGNDVSIACITSKYPLLNTLWGRSTLKHMATLYKTLNITQNIQNGAISTVNSSLPKSRAKDKKDNSDNFKISKKDAVNVANTPSVATALNTSSTHLNNTQNIKYFPYSLSVPMSNVSINNVMIANANNSKDKNGDVTMINDVLSLAIINNETHTNNANPLKPVLLSAPVPTLSLPLFPNTSTFNVSDNTTPNMTTAALSRSSSPSVKNRHTKTSATATVTAPIDNSIPSSIVQTGELLLPLTQRVDIITNLNDKLSSHSRSMKETGYVIDVFPKLKLSNGSESPDTTDSTNNSSTPTSTPSVTASATSSKASKDDVLSQGYVHTMWQTNIEYGYRVLIPINNDAGTYYSINMKPKIKSELVVNPDDSIRIKLDEAVPASAATGITGNMGLNATSKGKHVIPTITTTINLTSMLDNLGLDDDIEVLHDADVSDISGDRTKISVYNGDVFVSEDDEDVMIRTYDDSLSVSNLDDSNEHQDDTLSYLLSMNPSLCQSLSTNGNNTRRKCYITSPLMYPQSTLKLNLKAQIQYAPSIAWRDFIALSGLKLTVLLQRTLTSVITVSSYFPSSTSEVFIKPKTSQNKGNNAEESLLNNRNKKKGGLELSMHRTESFRHRFVEYSTGSDVSVPLTLGGDTCEYPSTSVVNNQDTQTNTEMVLPALSRPASSSSSPSLNSARSIHPLLSSAHGAGVANVNVKPTLPGNILLALLSKINRTHTKFETTINVGNQDIEVNVDKIKLHDSVENSDIMFKGSVWTNCEEPDNMTMTMFNKL